MSQSPEHPKPHERARISNIAIHPHPPEYRPSRDLEELRDGFTQEIDSLFTHAIAAGMLAVIGIPFSQKHGREYPDAPSTFGAGDPNAPQRIGRKRILVRDLADTYKRRDGLLLELTHGRIVRTWYDFLSKIFERILDEFFQGERERVASEGLQLRRLKLDRSIEDLDASIKEMLENAFNFAKADDQLSIVSKTLALQLSEESLRMVRLHTAVRNCIEHNAGIVRDADIKALGVAVISLTDNNAQEVRFGPGERLSITIWDIENLVVALTRAANELVP